MGDKNFLLGRAERLTRPVTVRSGGNPKNPPYSFTDARDRAASRLTRLNAAFTQLPSDACPRDEAVAVVTLHPRFVSKSDYPDSLFRAVGVRAVGSKPRWLTPERWGTKKHPESAMAEDVFVAGPRASFTQWGQVIGRWTEQTSGAKSLVQLEDLAAFEPQARIRGVDPSGDETLLEVVLHGGRDAVVLDAFEAFAIRVGARPFMDRLRRIRELAFVPVQVASEDVTQLAEFTFVRVARGMPTLRPFRPAIERADALHATVQLPGEGPLDSTTSAVVFDGGLPGTPNLSKWVASVDPPGIGKPVEDLQRHGLAVTSALLFGHIDGPVAPRPLCPVDHVRVLDEDTGSDLEYFDVLDRIIDHLDKHHGKYDFVNISLGPRVPVEDDDVTLWTAALDERFQHGSAFVTVAAGNDGLMDRASGLSRVQPPADAVNVLSVGSCDSNGPHWKRAPYSCVGPGRSPGVVKPDGLAFGGSALAPFMVLEPNVPNRARPTAGTSFAAPATLRSAVSIRVQLGGVLTALANRALVIHRADSGGGDRHDVGWGRFPVTPAELLTCDDDEAVAVYQGYLPVGQHLRASIPMPTDGVKGMVTLAATLLIAPEIEPEHPGSYTKSGVEVRFRPHSNRLRKNRDGSLSQHAKTRPFFNQQNMYAAAEYEFREEGHKWEPCLSSSVRMRGSGLHQPSFDIYYHRRESGTAPASQPTIAYALVVSLRAPKVTDLYNQVVRSHAGVLVPLQPRIHVPVSV